MSTNVAHGGYSRVSPRSLKQHDYAGGEGGYIELLEIENPPEECSGIVIHRYSSWSGEGQSTFWEWDSLEHAKHAFGFITYPKLFLKMPGFIRKVDLWTGATPWFYREGVPRQEDEGWPYS